MFQIQMRPDKQRDLLFGGKDVLYHNARIMNEIRNKFAHKLNPNGDRIRARIQNMGVPWKPKEVVGAMDRFEIHKNVSIATALNAKSAPEQNRNADFHPDVTIPDSSKQPRLAKHTKAR